MFLFSFLLISSEGGFNLLDFGPWANFVWTLLIFLVALPLMWVFVFKPITKALEERDHKAEEAVRASEEAKHAAQKAQAECESQLAGVRTEGQRILAESQSQAESRFKEIVAAAQTEASKNLERARTEIEREKNKALFEIREEVVDLTLETASKMLARKVSDEDSKKFVRDAVSQVQTLS